MGIIDKGYMSLDTLDHVYINNEIFDIQLDEFSSVNDIQKYEEILNVENDTFYENARMAPSEVEDTKFCVVIPSYNNVKYIVPCLNSVFIQNYHNWKMIFIDDASNDGTSELISRIKLNSQLSDEKFTILKHETRMRSALYSFYQAANNFCNDDEVMVHLDGDDMLASSKVLTILNDIYKQDQIWLTYGLFIYSNGRIGKDFNREISEDDWLRVRSLPWSTSHLRTSYTWLFKLIKLADLQYQGEFFHTAPDVAMMLPMLEMAGKHRTKFVEDILYLYRLSSTNEHVLYGSEQQQMNRYIRSLPQYKLLEKKLNEFYVQEGSVVLRTHGRIGNQLFQYAAAYSLAKRTGSKLYLFVDQDYEKANTYQYGLTFLNIPKENIIYKNEKNEDYIRLLYQDYGFQRNRNAISFAGKDFRIQNVDDCNLYEVAERKNDKILLVNDYMQSLTFINNYRNELLEQFKFTQIDFKKFLSIKEKLSQSNSVCIHVRRGDADKLSFYKTSISFHQQAIELTDKLIDNPRYFLFSDEILKVKNELKNYKNIEYIEGYSPIEDLYLMSNCGNNIITRSTFSLWAAYLNQNNGLVIAPYKFYHDSLYETFSTLELKACKKIIYETTCCPDNWILIDETTDFSVYTGNKTILNLCKDGGDFYPNLCTLRELFPSVI